MSVIKIPCELKKPFIIEGQPCKYLLDLIDGEIYGTDCYELYNLYCGMFFEQKQKEHTVIESPFECPALATKESFNKGMEQEMERYKQGYRYVSEWVTIRGEKWKKGHWVKEGFLNV